MKNDATTYQIIHRLWLLSIFSLLTYTIYVTFFTPTETLHLPTALLEPSAVMWDYFYGSYVFVTETLNTQHSTNFIGFLWVFSVVGMYIFYSFIFFVLYRLLSKTLFKQQIQVKAL